MPTATENRALYLAWLKDAAPPLYFDAMRAAQNQPPPYTSGTIGGFWSSVGNTFTSFASNVTTALPGIATAYAGYQNQKDLIKANTQRAQQGMAPLVYDANGQLTTYQGPGYTDQEYRIAQTASNNTLLMVSAALFLGFILVLRK